MEIISKKINFNNKNYAYHICGDGEPIIFLSGWGVPYPLAYFYQEINKIKDFHTCIVIDRLGYGDSDIACDNNFEAFLDFFIKHMNLKDVTLVGHSMGASYALKFADNLKIKKIILLDFYPVTNLGLDMKKFFAWILKKLREKGKIQNVSEKFIIKQNRINYALPAEIKEKVVHATKNILYNDCVLSEIDKFKNYKKKVYKTLKNLDINLVCICRKKSYKENIKLKKYINNCKVIKVDPSSHCVDHDHLRVVLKEMK